jgi:hypothetical protein
MKHQHTTEVIHRSKSRLLKTCTATFLIQTTVMSTTLTTSTLETPTLTILTLFAIILASVIVAHAPQVHSTLAYLPSPGKINQLVARVNPWWNRILRTEATRNRKINQLVARVNPWWNRILRTEATRNHGRQERRDTTRSIPNRAHYHHLWREPCAHRSRRLSNWLTTHPPTYPPTHPLHHGDLL